MCKVPFHYPKYAAVHGDDVIPPRTQPRVPKAQHAANHHPQSLDGPTAPIDRCFSSLFTPCTPLVQKMTLPL
jgi:hypothetical protein